MRSYAIVGTGAVGGYYGACLQQAGQDVHFLVRSDYPWIHEYGLRVDSPKGDMVLRRVKAYARPADMPRCDVALLAWKTTHNRFLADTLPHVVKPGGVVLVLQNGLDPEREVAPHAGTAAVLAGLCFLCSRKEGPGHVRHQDFGAVTLAAYTPAPEVAAGVTSAMREVAEDLRSSGIEVRLHEDWRAARWRKLVWNVPFNGLCALHRADTRALLAMPGMRDKVARLMGEVMAGAALQGHALPEGFAARMLEDTDRMIPYEPSMKLDRDQGRDMELEAIYARPLEAIRGAGGRAPEMEALLRDLRALR